MKNIRQATKQDTSRIAEILVFNNRIICFPIFKDENYSFKELQVILVAEEYSSDEILKNVYLYDDGIVRGMIRIENNEIKKLFVDSFFQGRGIGRQLLDYAVKHHQANHLWALEKNIKALSFYEKNGFHATDEKVFEEGTNEYLIKLIR